MTVEIHVVLAWLVRHLYAPPLALAHSAPPRHDWSTTVLQSNQRKRNTVLHAPVALKPP